MINEKQSWIAGYVVVVISFLLLIYRKSLIADSIAGIVVQIIAVLLMLWARLIFGRRSFHAAANPTEGGLVTSGPYKFIRHPIYAAIIYFLWAGVLSHLSVINLLIGLSGTIGLAVRMRAEEILIIKRYPEYSQYAAHTGRIIPYLF